MSLSIRLLGTSASRPTVERNVSSLAIHREGETLMFDCGEGTQRQMMRYGVSFALEDIFFTHMHADHLLGVIGLIRTMALQGRDRATAAVGTSRLGARAQARRGARLRAHDVSGGDPRARSRAAGRAQPATRSSRSPSTIAARRRSAMRSSRRIARDDSIRISRASWGFPKVRCGDRSIAAKPSRSTTAA